MKQNTQERNLKRQKSKPPSLPAKANQSTAVTATKTREREALEAEVRKGFLAATGAKFERVAFRLLSHVSNALVWPSAEKDASKCLITSSMLLAEMEPKNPTEAMLATQMIAAHEASLMFLWRAAQKEQTTEAIDANVTRATRLMRLFKDQTEAMAKLKGTAGQQKVTVEHVNVYSGGQAVVGAITPGGGGGKDGNG